MSKFQEWFDIMQDVGEHCGTSLGQWHMELMESAWDDSREDLKAENESLRADAERYRWIRGNGDGQDFVYLSTRGEEMDEAIDKKLNRSPENPSL